MRIREHRFIDNKLVVQVEHFVVYFNIDGLLTNFLHGKVPIGILIDYLEEHPELLESNQNPIEFFHNLLITTMRAEVKDPTTLYNPELLYGYTTE
jgi:hypothetical protein